MKPPHPLHSAAGVGLVTIALQLSVLAQGAGTVLVPGLLKFEAYTNITGTAVQGLLDDPAYPNSPGEVQYLSEIDTRTIYPTDVHENYGARITGLVTPPESGEYEFFLRSDDSGQLWLSTDETEANLQQVAEEAGCCNAFLESGASQTSAPIPLVSGKSYLIQVLYKEGGGGDFCQVAWRKVGDGTAAANLSPIPAAYLSSRMPASGNLTVTRQPVASTAAQNDRVTFSVEAQSGTSPLLVQWRKNGVLVPGLTGSTVTFGPLPATDNGARIQALLSAPGAVATSEEVILTVTPDVTAPTVLSAVASSTFEQMTLEFSEAITAGTASVAANYRSDGGLTITSVTVVSPQRVRIGTSRQTPGQRYTLTLNNLTDTGGLKIAADTTVVVPAFGPEKGGLLFEAFLNISGTAVQGMLDDPRYPDSPDITGYVTSFSSRGLFTDSSHENYGGRMSGWLVPTETAQYQFFLRSDDASQLFLSTDETEANLQQIAEETGCCGPFENPDSDLAPPETSAPVSLTAGKRYFIRALWKEGGGGDYCDVAWRKVGDPAVPQFLPYIPGAVLETLAAPLTFVPPTVAIAAPTTGANFPTNAPVTFSATVGAAAGKTVAKVEYFESTKKLGEATAAPWSLTLGDLAADVHTVFARVTDSAGITAESEPVTVTVGESGVARLNLVAVDATTEWSYDRSGTDLGTEWRQRAYNDTAWPKGKALIADETTTTVEPVRTPISRFNDAGDYVKTFYFRTRFQYQDLLHPSVVLRLRHVVDDGAIFYLNGTEIHRFGIAEGPVDATTDATGHENIYEGPFDIPASLLVAGENVLAAEVHQSGGSSSDMVFGAELIASVPTIITNVAAIDAVTEWSYDRSGQDLGSSWTSVEFNDTAWPKGKALIADESTTTVEPIRTPISRLNDAGEYVKTFYFRTRFNFVSGSASRVSAKLRHVVDDGAIFYLNGTEIHRFGIPEGPVDATTDAAGHENIYEGPYDVPPALLRQGVNVLAAEVHQSGGSSSDMVFGGEFVITIRPSASGGGGGGEPPVLAAPKLQNGSVTLEWIGGGTLQSAESVAGPWSDVPAAISPHQASPAGPARFYRIQK